MLCPHLHWPCPVLNWPGLYYQEIYDSRVIGRLEDKLQQVHYLPVKLPERISFAVLLIIAVLLLLLPLPVEVLH
jgi:hypothetical protein